MDKFVFRSYYADTRGNRCVNIKINYDVIFTKGEKPQCTFFCRGKQILSVDVKMVARVLALFWSSSLITVSPLLYSEVVVLKSTLCHIEILATRAKSTNFQLFGVSSLTVLTTCSRPSKMLLYPRASEIYCLLIRESGFNWLLGGIL